MVKVTTPLRGRLTAFWGLAMAPGGETSSPHWRQTRASSINRSPQYRQTGAALLVLDNFIQYLPACGRVPASFCRKCLAGNDQYCFHKGGDTPKSLGKRINGATLGVL